MKNSSQDFKVKKEFIDLQHEVKRFVEETDIFTLKDIMKDPIIAHSLDSYISAYKEQEDIKFIRKTLKGLYTLKKRSIDIHSLLEEISHDTISNNDNNGQVIEPPQDKIRDNSLPKEKISNERMIQIFKSHIKRINSYKKYSIQKHIVNRSQSTSASHSHLFKKIEKSTDNTQSPNKLVNEITLNVSYRNGIMRPTSAENIYRSPIQGAVPNQQYQSSTIIKANRSPRQNDSNGSPSELKLSPDYSNSESQKDSQERRRDK